MNQKKLEKLINLLVSIIPIWLYYVPKLVYSISRVKKRDKS